MSVYLRIIEIRELHWNNTLFSSHDCLTVTVNLFNYLLNTLNTLSGLNSEIIFRIWHCSPLSATSAVPTATPWASLPPALGRQCNTASPNWSLLQLLPSDSPLYTQQLQEALVKGKLNLIISQLRSLHISHYI